jgi:glycosyltransferase involved in cell wall biosynthesis
MRPLRIALVLIEPPLPFGNAAGRWFFVLLRGLVARGHRVSAFAACSKSAEIAAAHDLFPSPAYDLRLFPFPDRCGWRAKAETLVRPYSYMFAPALKAALAATLDQGVDVLHLEQLWSGWLGLGHADRTLINVHYLSAIDLGKARPGSPRARLERALATSAERRLIKRYQFLRAVSDRLAQALRQIHPAAEVRTVPLGLDASLYPFIPAARRNTEAAIVTLIGSMDWYPSYSAAVRLLTRLWPEIKRQVPAARLQIAGWSARQRLAPYLRENIDLTDVAVDQDVANIGPYFERAGIFLYAPERGSGMKVKVQEAMAFGVPVVTTREGVEGLPALDGQHAGISDDDEGLIARTVELLRDPGRQDRQRHAARQLVEAHCGPAPTLDAIEAIYDQMLAPPRSHGADPESQWSNEPAADYNQPL